MDIEKFKEEETLRLLNFISIIESTLNMNPAIDDDVTLLETSQRWNCLKANKLRRHEGT